MGEIADQLIDEEMFGTYHYGRGLAKTPKKSPSVRLAEKKIASVRKEIAILVQSGTDLEEARRLMNCKYGKGWRERGLCAYNDDQWSEEHLKNL